MTIFAPEFSYSLFHWPGASSGLWSTYTKGWRGIILKNGAGSGGVDTEDILSKAKKMREKELNPKKIHFF